MVTADEQTAGKGRYQRTWASPKGVNLYATFCFRLHSNAGDLPSLAQIMSFSLASLLIEEGLQPKIKWPNDVLLNDKKVSGILCETIFESTWVHIFLGIGVNINMGKADLERIDQPATSLQNETGKTWDRRALLNRLEELFSTDLEQFKKTGFASFHDPVEALLAHKGSTIRCFDGKKEWVGVCHSLAKDGRLNLLLPNGEIHAVFSGDIKFRS